MDEYRKAQPVSGYPIKLPLVLKKLRSRDNPEVIRAFADILGSLMQPTDRSPVDHLKTQEFISSLTIHMLTMNHGNLTRNPKLDNREVYNMAMKDRPIVKMMMQNSAHILCLNEADTFLSPQDENSRELIKTFIRFGYKGIVIKQWSSRPIACFLRGGPSARVELLAKHMSTKSQNWGTTFGMSSEPGKIALILNTTFRPRTAWQLRDHPCLLNPRSTSDRDCHHATLSKDTDVTK